MCMLKQDPSVSTREIANVVGIFNTAALYLVTAASGISDETATSVSC